MSSETKSKVTAFAKETVHEKKTFVRDFRFPEEEEYNFKLETSPQYA